MIAWMMDAKIRLATGGENGLEQFFQRLWQQRGDGPLVDDDLREVFAGLTGQDPAPFWREYIQGRAELDAKEITKAYGLRFESLAPWEQSASGEAAKDRTRSYTGISFSGDAPVIKNVLPGSPAAKAGLSYGHEIIAVGGWRTASADAVQQRFRDCGVGEKVDVLAVDRGRIQRHELELAENPFRSIRLVPSAAPSPFQRTVFQSWTGQPYPARTRGRP